MTTWNQENVRSHMRVYASNGKHVGHVAATYEDSFLVHKGYFFPTDRYLPYNLIRSIEEDQLRLSLSPEELAETRWSKRPDYEHHLGDPMQLFYDEGHGIPDPFARNSGAESGPEQPTPP